MALTVKLDEGLSEMMAEPLRRHGYSVMTVRGQGWGGVKDPDLWPLVQAEALFFISIDKGFSDIRVYPPGSHAGILVLRPDRESLIDYLALLDEVLQLHALEEFSRCVAVATPRGVRVRREPLPGAWA